LTIFFNSDEAEKLWVWKCAEKSLFYYENGREIRLKGYKFRDFDLKNEDKIEIMGNNEALIEAKSPKTFFFIVKKDRGISIIID